jgi:hypothetical protein
MPVVKQLAEGEKSADPDGPTRMTNSPSWMSIDTP